MSNGRQIVSELENTLTQLQGAQAAASARSKAAADGHDGTSLPHGQADDGDQNPVTGGRHREMNRDAEEQNSLHHQNTGGTAESPELSTAASSGDITGVKADASSQKPHADDPGTGHPARVDKEAQAILKLGADLLLASGDEDGATKLNADIAALLGAAEGGAPGEETPTEGSESEEGEEGEEGEYDDEEMEKMAAAIDQLLPVGVNASDLLAIPDLPTTDAGMQKFASEKPDELRDIVTKIASILPADVNNGFNVAARIHAGLAQAVNSGGQIKLSQDDERALQELQKFAEQDAEDVADMLEGMSEEGDPEGEEGMEDEGATGEASPDEGGTGAPVDPAAMMGMPADPGMGADVGMDAEQLLMALQAAGVPEESMMKAAMQGGLSKSAAERTFARLKAKAKAKA